MKNFKRIASIVMVIMMMLSMMVPAMAGTITVENASIGETYNAYKIFDVTIAKDDNGNYLVDENGNFTTISYMISKNSEWKTAVEEYTQKVDENDVKVFKLTPSADDSSVLVVTLNEYDTVGDDGSSVKEKMTLDAAAFAVYLDSNKNGKTVSGNAKATDTTVEIDVKDAGYYFVDSSLGALCILKTSADEVKVEEKNELPSLTKEVDDKEAQIGDTVEYTITVTVPKTVDKKLTVHDTIEDGLTINTESFAVKVDSVELTKDSDYVVIHTCTDGCSFEIVLNATDSVKGKVVKITYKAEVNKKAVMNAETNDNTAWLTYSEYTTPEVIVPVYTFEFTLNKVDVSGNRLEGAIFNLFRDSDTDPVKLIKDNDGTYRIADSTELKVTDPEDEDKEIDNPDLVTDIEVGSTVIKGIDFDSEYTLKEIKAPAGYNKLEDTISFKLQSQDVTIGSSDYTFYEAKTIDVVNQTGTELPSTGGIGTTIFYCVGAVLAVGAFVLLITKKRMSKEV